MDVSLRQHAKGTIVDIHGDVDMRSSAELLKRLETATTDVDGIFVVNLGNVSFMDSSGIAVLIETLKNLKKRNVSMVLVAMNQNIREVFNLSRLDQVFTILDSEEAL